ncbi:hypothetical protein [Penaeicola halotolerans]|uniref:hypothetical protein n=1 Tax=Penaeicola halotolerans TaxID=2793196 RepID=UPI001CF8E2EC|nr:hypothetical protein [Penaeicola halotolerans]
MKRQFFTSVTLCLLLCFACDDFSDIMPNFQLETADQLDADEYAIYSSILSRYSTSELVIRQRTSDFTPVAENFALFFNLEVLSEMDEGLFDSYTAANAESFNLDESIQIPMKQLHLLSNEGMNYFFNNITNENAWTRFEKQYPQSGIAYHVFNRVGFNDTKTQALVGVEMHWYQQGSNETQKLGSLNYLEKVNGTWMIIRSASYELN